MPEQMAIPARCVPYNPCTGPPTFEVVAKSIKALNHEEHEGHKGIEKLFLVLFVVPFFSGPFATPSKMVSEAITL